MPFCRPSTSTFRLPSCQRSRGVRLHPIVFGACGFWLVSADVAYAVIPGLAPGLAAILPQLFLLLFTTMGLLLAPRTWWRLALTAVRHPVRAGGIGLAAALLLLGVRQLLEWLPHSEAGVEISDGVAGFPVGDRYAARTHAHGLGPVSTPQSSACRWTPNIVHVPEDAHELTSFGDRVLVLLEGRRRLVCFDPVPGAAAWEVTLESPVVADPLGFERVLETGERSAGVVLVTGRRADRSEYEPETIGGGEIIVLEGRDGSIAGRLQLPAAPDTAAALVDERLLVALDRSIVCISLAAPSRPVELWRMPRPPRRTIGIAGDRSGRFFLLDSERLAIGDLDGARLRDVQRFRPESPLRLTVYRDRAYVLSRSGEQTARLVCFDPALPFASGCELWSCDIERSVYDELAVGAAGVVMPFPKGIEIRDLQTGSPVRRLTLDTPPTGPVAVAGSACYILLSNAEVLRYSPALDRVVWRMPLDATARDDGSSVSATSKTMQGGVVLAGDRLVVEVDGAPHVIAETPRGLDVPWGQWRGGPQRAGTSDGQLAPLSASILWRRQAQPSVLPKLVQEAGGAKKSRVNTDQALDASRQTALLPLANGWLVAWSFDSNTLFQWVGDDGVLHAQIMLDGVCAGMARLQDQVYAALRRTGARDQTICVAARQPAGEPASLRVLWRATTDPLSENHPLAATSGRLVISLASSIRVVSSEDGMLQWECTGIGGAAAPLIANSQIYVAGHEAGTDRSVALALDLRDGQVLWRRHFDGEWGGPLSLSGDSLFASLTMPVGDGRVQCLSAQDGSLRWEHVVGERVMGALAEGEHQLVFRASGGTHFVLSTGGQELSRHGSATSEKLEQGTSSRPDAASPDPVIGFGMMILADGRMLRCMDSATFDTVWEVELPAPVSVFALARGRIVVCSGSEITCFGVE